VSPRAVTVLVALGAGVIAGMVLDVLTVLVARYGIEGNGWSLRGNGALVVPFGLGPALLTGAWTALVLHGRTRPDWLSRGVGVGVLGAALLAASAVLLILLGSAAGVAQGLLIATLAWMILAPVLAVSTRGPARSVGLHAGSGGRVHAGTRPRLRAHEPCAPARNLAGSPFG
jgi:hypothetical protein